MTPQEHRRVEALVRSIYANWHGCALSPKEARQMKLKRGRLCDSCEDFVKAHMKDLKETTR